MTKTPLAPCPSCARHVRVSEAACPFCAAPLPRALREQTAPTSPARRLNRAALYALRMGAVSMAAAACGGSVSGNGGDGGGGSGGDSAAVQDGAGGDDTSEASSGGQEDAPFDDAPNVVAAYGGFIPADADVTEPPVDAGQDAEPADAKPDHIFIAPPYGLPPAPG